MSEDVAWPRLCYETVIEPTAVTHAVSAQLMGPQKLNLIVCRSSYVDLYELDPSGLVLVCSDSIWGAVAVLQPMRAGDVDVLFVCTVCLQFSIVAYEDGFVTKYNGTVDVLPSFSITNSFVTPGLAGLQVRESEFVLLTFSNGQHFQHSLRLSETNIESVLMVVESPPTIAVLATEADKHSVLRMYTLNMAQSAIVATLTSECRFDEECKHLVMVKQGILVVGHVGVYLVVGNVKKYVKYRKPMSVVCVSVADDAVLLAELPGRFYLVTFDELKVQFIGCAECCTVICYLDSGYFFSGSLYGDARVLKIKTLPDVEGELLLVAKTISNIGPIADAVLLNPDCGSGAMLVTCSGTTTSGSLRIIQHGLCVSLATGVYIKLVDKIFVAGRDVSTYLCISALNTSFFLELADKQYNLFKPNALEDNERTLLFEAVRICDDDFFVCQVTPSKLLISDMNSSTIICECPFTPELESACLISNPGLSFNGFRFRILAANYSSLFNLSLSSTEAPIQSQPRVFNAQISSINVEYCADGYSPTFLGVIGLFNDEVHVIHVNTLQTLAKVSLADLLVDAGLSCAMLFTDEKCHLLVGSRDGKLVIVPFDTRKKEFKTPHILKCGSQQVTLSRCFGEDACVLCGSDTSLALYYDMEHNLAQCGVNVADVRQMHSLLVPGYPENTILYSTSMGVFIGEKEQIARTHVRKQSLKGETGLKIVYCGSSRCIIIASTLVDEFPMTQHAYRLRALSVGSFDEVGFYAFEANENVTALEIHNINHLEVCQAMHPNASIALHGPPQLIMVGTTIEHAHEFEATQGRILFFKLTSAGFELLCEYIANGGVYCLRSFEADKIVAGIRNRAALFDISHVLGIEHMDGKLREICHHDCLVLPLFLSIVGDRVFVGDLALSVTLLEFNREKSLFDVIARDRQNAWMTALAGIDKDTCFAADKNNLTLLSRQNTDADCDPFVRLAGMGCFESVNLILAGSLDEFATHHNIVRGTHLVCYISGRVASIGLVDDRHYVVLRALYFELLKLTKESEPQVLGFGSFDYSQARSIKRDLKTDLSRGFIDGDLIPRYFKLKDHLRKKVLHKINSFCRVTSSELDAIVSEFTK